MKRKMPAWLLLTLIAAAAGLLLSLTNAITAPVIEQSTLAAADADRLAVFPEAESFTALALGETATVDSCYEANRDGKVIGYVGTATVKGYGGDIEVTVGVTGDFVITGIAVGGANFSESAGLGSRTRDPEFTEQFMGARAPVTIGKNIDAVTGATISSSAVVSAVNRVVKYIENLGKDPAETDLYHNVVDAACTALSGDGTIDSAYMTADGGYIVFASAAGYHGDIHVVVLMDAAGVITQVAIDETEFYETAGLGEKVLEKQFLAQFIGLCGVIGIDPGDPDAESGATGAADSEESDPDAESGATGAVDREESDHDAESGATGAVDSEESDHDAESGATGAADSAGSGHDAESGATGAVNAGEGSDAASSATVVIEPVEDADVNIDGVSGATYSSLAVAKAVNAALRFVADYIMHGAA